ncbi:SDR family NAD(P)-dependent oxidoreductase [Roseivirga sp. E12]|uniref:SDR family NAD(P)-dependent oxidoreductase n=1 Tax=Roseivirga sp. E12 TaxID=2819237 RepID=UPI001ABBEAEE|nr:SDR family oxidoreductase [Roseivirga sp. E12]MBO3698779.1 SDR family oxidoreductase [Roseivirga sp. E12]
MEISLKGKVVLVTGGSRGIGKAICEGLAGANATVAVHYNSSQEIAEALCQSLGNGAKPFQASLEQASSTISLFEQVINHYGRIDVLINNAGIAISSDIGVDDTDWLADWEKTFAVNTRATGLLCKKAIEHFGPNGGGRIINISSRAAFRGDTMDYLAYGASKGAIPSLTRSIARHCGKQNIKAFNIAPGFVRTDMAQDFMDQYGESFALDDIALTELTEPKNLAPMVVLLASGLADHATGTTIDINAGSYVH